MTDSTATGRRARMPDRDTPPRATRAGTPPVGRGTRAGGGRRTNQPDTPGHGYADELDFGTAGATALAPQPETEPRRRTPAQPPRLRVAPPPAVSGPRAPFVALVLAVVVAGVLGILVLNTKINENAFTLNRLRNQQAELDRQEQELSRQIADFSSPNNLAAAARKLGLVPSGTPAFITLPDGRSVGLPQPATGVPSASGQTGTATEPGAGGSAGVGSTGH